MPELPDQPEPGAHRLQRIELNARAPGDEHRFWRTKFDMQGKTIGHAVIASEDANPVCIAANGPAAEWIVRRLNRAAFLETALLQQLGSLIAFANSSGQAGNVDVKAGRVIEQLVKVYNQDETQQEVPANVIPN